MDEILCHKLWVLMSFSSYETSPLSSSETNPLSSYEISFLVDMKPAFW